MSGFYNNWVKVQNQDANLYQMKSEAYQPPFYFGGSQVPTALHKEKNISGSGMCKYTEPIISSKNQITGGIRRSRIMIPNKLP
jgi:hypothetical protein